MSGGQERIGEAILDDLYLELDGIDLVAEARLPWPGETIAALTVARGIQAGKVGKPS